MQTAKCRKLREDISSFSLHIFAMCCMLCDHLWAIGLVRGEWLTWVGRLAFPIFAFLLVEGFFHTKSRPRYALRLFLLAIASEVPFDLVYGGRVFYPFHQNVIWTFLIGLGLLAANEAAKRRGSPLLRLVAAMGTALAGYLVGMLTMVDYYGVGVLTVLLFYFARGRKWYHFVLQAMGLWFLNAELLGGLEIVIRLFGTTVFLLRQSVAVVALLPIVLYRGRQGHYNRSIRFLYYAFYPVHLLLLYGIALCT